MARPPSGVLPTIRRSPPASTSAHGTRSRTRLAARSTVHPLAMPPKSTATPSGNRISRPRTSISGQRPHGCGGVNASPPPPPTSSQSPPYPAAPRGGGTAGSNRPPRTLAAPGRDVVEVAVVSARHEGREHRGIEQPAGHLRGLQREQQHLQERPRHPGPPSGGLVHPGDLGLRAKPAEPFVLPHERRLHDLE